MDLLFYWICTRVYSMRLANSHSSTLVLRGHVFESPLHANYLWSMFILMLGMMMNGWLFYFFLLSTFVEMMTIHERDTLPNLTWTLNGHEIRHEYVMVSLLTCSFLLTPSILKLLLHLGLLGGFYYLDTNIVRPFLSSHQQVMVLDEDKKEQ